MQRLLIFVGALVLLWWWAQGGAARHPPGVLVREAPTQHDLDNNDAPRFQHGRYSIKALASFDLNARVLSRADYDNDEIADLVPTDLALGWGPMSDSAVLDELTITQSYRWWSWTTSDLPVPQAEINRSAANMHLIPANDAARAALDAVREGDLVRIHGYLVEARRDDGYRLTSSLSRTDTGGGACEVIWVESLSTTTGG